MNFLYTAILVLTYTAICTLLGLAISKLWPKSLEKSLTGICISPALGLAAFTIIANAIGWLQGFKPALVLPITLALAATGYIISDTKRKLAIQIALFSLIPSFACLATVATNGDLPYFQDAFTYLVHSQWLQNHSFISKVANDPLAPAYTQVAIYQGLELRMGASFLLGWFQAATMAPWATDVYPAVIGLFITTGSTALIGWIGAIAPGKRRIAIAAGIASACSIGGFAYGAVAGFFPQTCGLAISAGYFAALSRLPIGRPSLSAKNLFPLAILLAAVGFAYSELLPFVLATTGIWFIIALATNNKNRRQIWIQAGIFTTITLAIWNLEVLRITHAILGQAKAVVGWCVPWPALDFPAHALGLRSGSGDGNLKLMPRPVYYFVVFLLCITIPFAIRNSLKAKRPILNWAPAVGFMFLCTIAFTYFRWAAQSPWPDGTGQTWNQFKLSNWSSLCAITLTAAILAWTCMRKSTANIASIALLALGAGGFVSHYRLTPERMSEMIRQTGRSYNPVSAYRDMRTVVTSARHDKPVYLDLGGASHKGRQIAAFFLHDIPVISDWSDDGYIYPWLTPGWQQHQISECSLVVSMTSGDEPEPNESTFNIGKIRIAQPPAFLPSLSTIAGGYALESDSSGWWIWASRNINIEYNLRIGAEKPFFLTFDALSLTQNQSITIKISGLKTPDYTKTIEMTAGWNRPKLGPLKADGEKVAIAITSNTEPQRISETDQRMATFLIKNAILKPATTH